MKLVITEKPSVANSIAKVIGATKKKNGYLEGNGYLVSWCVGHLVELAQPQTYDEVYEKWRKEDLPIFPTRWKYQVSTATRKQYQILKDLMEREDVESLVEATDAGREGELIFRLVYHQARCKKPFERLWISSMEDESISKGFENLIPGTEYDKLYQAALCRERADWMVGINATRLFSCLYGQTLNVGRVMTPTLSLVVERSEAINSFRPETFYQLMLSADGIVFRSERIKEKSFVEDLEKKCKECGKVTITQIEKKEKQEKAPELFDLTSLQREANKKLGYTAQQTLDYTQSLYEKKLCSYPRTDSRYVTEDMEQTVNELLIKMQISHGVRATAGKDVRKIVNNKKVTDHHAILPTTQIVKQKLDELPKGEQEILNLLVIRLAESVSSPCIIAETIVKAECGSEIFTAKGKQILDSGWKGVAGTTKSGTGNHSGGGIDEQTVLLMNLAEGKSIAIKETEYKEGKTTPPKMFTEDTLLSAMEKAGAEGTPEEAERKGLGTPATRAGTIEKLVKIGFIERKGDKKTKYLYPSQKGVALIKVIPDVIKSPTMTAEWEQKLLDIEKENFSQEEFMSEIESMLKEIVDTYEAVADAEVMMHPVHEKIGDCPCCGSAVVEKAKGFFCEDKDCKFALWKDNRFFDSLSKKMTKTIAKQLVKDGKAKMKNCKSVKSGKTYDCIVTLVLGEDGRVNYGMEFEKKKEKGER